MPLHCTKSTLWYNLPVHSFDYCVSVPSKDGITVRSWLCDTSGGKCVVLDRGPELNDRDIRAVTTQGLRCRHWQCAAPCRSSSYNLTVHLTLLSDDTTPFGFRNNFNVGAPVKLYSCASQIWRQNIFAPLASDIVSQVWSHVTMATEREIMLRFMELK